MVASRPPLPIAPVKSFQTPLLLLLAVTTVGGGILAWRQYRELVELRAAALHRTERADLQKRVWDLEKANRELRDQLAARAGTAAADAGRTTAGERTAAAAAGRRDERDPRLDPRHEAEVQFSAVRELVNKPEVQAMIGLQQRGAVESRYAPLFRNLNLPPEQVEKLKSLLAERATTVQDVLAVAIDQGINPRENPATVRKLVADAQNEINQGIRAVIGDQGFAQLTNYERTLPQRAVVNELQQRLSYTNAPLTGPQAEQLVQILAANPPPRPAPDAANASRPPPPPPPGPRGPDVGALVAGLTGGGPGPDVPRGAPVTPAAVSQAATILSAPQVSALQQMQQQQQSQQQLRQMLNETLSAARGTPAAGTSPAPGSGGATPAPNRGAPKAPPRGGG